MRQLVAFEEIDKEGFVPCLKSYEVEVKRYRLSEWS